MRKKNYSEFEKKKQEQNVENKSIAKSKFLNRAFLKRRRRYNNLYNFYIYFIYLLFLTIKHNDNIILYFSIGDNHGKITIRYLYIIYFK